MVNDLRKWLGEPTLDDDSTDTTMLHDPTLELVDSLLENQLETFDYPTSPGGWNMEAQKVNQQLSTPQPIETLDQSRMLVLDENRKKRKLNQPSAEPPSKTKEKLVALLRTYAGTWPTLTGNIGLANPEVATRIEYAAKAISALGYDELIEAGVAKVYEQNIADVKTYLAWVAGRLGVQLTSIAV